MSTGSRVQSFPRTFLSLTDVSVLLLNQPNKERQQISSNVFQYTSSFYRFYLSFYIILVVIVIIIVSQYETLE